MVAHLSERVDRMLGAKPSKGLARTTIRGLAVARRTLSITLPRTQRVIPDRPWVDMMIRVPGSVAALLTM